MRKSALIAIAVLVIGLGGVAALALLLMRVEGISPGPETRATPSLAPVAQPTPQPALPPASLAERLLPADAQAVFLVRNVPQLIRDAKTTDLGALLAEPQVADYLRSVLAAALDAVAPPEEPGDRVQQFTAALENFSGEIALAARVEFQRPEPRVGVCLFAEVRHPQQLGQWIQDLAELSDTSVTWAQHELAGLTVQTARKDNFSVFYAMSDDAFFAGFGNGVNLFDDMLGRYRVPGVAPDSLWHNASYQFIKTKLPDAAALVFADVPALAELVTRAMTEEGMDATSIDALHLDGFGPLALSMSFSEGSARAAGRLILNDATRGLPALLASLPKDRPDGLLDALPSQTLFVMAATVDPPELWRSIKALVAEVSPNAFADMEQALQKARTDGELDVEADLISPMGRAMALFVPSDEGPFPPIGVLRNISSTLLVLEMKEPARFLKAIDAQLTKINKLRSPNASYRGVEVRTIEVDLGQAKGLLDTFTRIEPSYAAVGNLFVAGLNPSSVKIFIREHQEAKSTLRSNAALQQALAKLPQDFSQVQFTDTAATVRTAYDVVIPMFGMIGKLIPGGKLKVDMAALPPKEIVAKHVTAEIATLSVRPNELAYDGVMSPGGRMLVEAVQAQAMISMLSEIHDARDQARTVLCQNHLKQLAMAVMEYHDTKGQGTDYPPNLAALVNEGVLKDTEVLVCRKDSAPRLLQGIKTSYETAFELAPPGSADRFRFDLPMAWDSAPRHNGSRNVAFFDGHIEELPEEQFQALLEKLREALKAPE